MNDRDSLYRAVLENPDDDTLRLVYADALEEGGDPRRAAFVRAHVELARVPEYEPEAVQARYHNQKKKADGGRWITELPPLPDGLSWARDPFRRGLPGAVQANDGAAFVAHAAELFALYPIESLELRGLRVADMAALAACEWLSRLHSLSLVEGAGRSILRLLLDSEHFERLTELHLGAQLTTSTAVAALVRSRVFDRLTSLSVREDRPGGGSLVGTLGQLAKPPRFKKLDLSSNRITEPALVPLLASTALQTVEELNLSDNNLGAEGLEVLAGATLPNLRVLNLIRTRPTAAGAQSLTGASFFPQLRSLALGGNNLPSSAAERLAQASGGGLRVLSLDGNRTGGRGAAALAGGAGLSGLLVLDLAEANVDDDGADALAQSEHLSGLMYLNLYGNTLTAGAAGRLRKRFGDRVFL